MSARAREKHGMTNTKEYRAWENIKKRCLCITDPHYPRWGGRGITICDRWRDSFMAFFEDIGRAPSPDYTIERKENDQGYSPENCRWAHKSEQAANTRKNVFLTHDGLTLTLSEWCRRTGLDIGCLGMRVRLGWPASLAITTPSDPRNKRNGVKLEHQGRTQSMAAWAKELGLNKAMVSKRLKAGQTIAEALSPSTSKKLSSKS